METTVINSLQLFTNEELNTEIRTVEIDGETWFVAADVAKVQDQIINLLGCKREEIIGVSAKTGLNVEQVLERIVESAPAPRKI